MGRRTLRVEVARIGTCSELGDIPRYAKPGDAGLDLYAAIPSPVELWPGERAMIPTGISVAIPDGYAGFIWPRSGLAYKHGVDVLAGLVDSGYRGEVAVILIYHAGLLQSATAGPTGVKSHAHILINPGDRIAQLVIAPVAEAVLVEVERLSETERAAGGFGSSGR